jgi:hypothetical protein
MRAAQRVRFGNPGGPPAFAPVILLGEHGQCALLGTELDIGHDVINIDIMLSDSCS